MSKTAVVWLIIYVGGLLYAFIGGPIIALLTYIFTFYTQFSWASEIMQFMPRLSLYAGIVFLASYILTKGTTGSISHGRMPQLKWLILIIINMLLLTPFAAWPEENEKTVIAFVKIIVLYYLIIKSVQNKLHYRMFIWLQLWGNYLFGWQAYGSNLTAGRLEKIGGPGTNDANGLANHMIMIIPFIGNMFFHGKKWEKIATIWATPFILNTIILCRSRGSFIAIIAMAVSAILFTQKGIMRIKMVLGLILGSILFIQLTDPQFWERIQTINSYEKDGSAMERLESWKSAMRMIGDYPLGKGGGGWEAYSPIYIPEVIQSYGGKTRSVHNTFLMMATDWGIQGLVLLLLFLVSTFLELHKIRKRTGTDDDRFYHTESVAIEVSLIGFLTAALFGNRIYAEGLYWYCAIAVALSNIQQNALLEVKNKSCQ